MTVWILSIILQSNNLIWVKQISYDTRADCERHNQAAAKIVGSFKNVKGIGFCQVKNSI